MLVHNIGCDIVPGQPKKFHGNDSRSTEPRETYTHMDDQGKPYHGVGDVEVKRADESLERLRDQNPERTFENTDRTRHETSADALKDEYNRQNATGKGTMNDQYGKRWSPGKKLSGK